VAERIVGRSEYKPAADIDLSVKTIRKTEFAKRLYSLMMAKDWNQSDLARASGLGRDSVSQYIRANNTPSPQNLKKLAEALGVEPVELYPNYEAAAIEEEIPSLSFRQMPGDDDHMWVRINKKVPKAVATQIMVLMNE
jgi:transcriptional regulator with XRE-family HTH domain